MPTLKLPFQLERLSSDIPIAEATDIDIITGYEDEEKKKPITGNEQEAYDTIKERVEKNEAVDTTQDERLTALEENGISQDERLTELEKKETTQDGRLDTLQATNASIEKSLASVKSKNTTQDGRLTSLENHSTATYTTAQIDAVLGILVGGTIKAITIDTTNKLLILTASDDTEWSIALTEYQESESKESENEGTESAESGSASNIGTETEGGNLT